MPRPTISPSLDPKQDARMADFLDQAKVLMDRYGRDPFTERLADFSHLLGTINELNSRYSKLDSEALSESDLVAQIVTATGEYYSYMGQQPEDIRQFFLLLTEYAGSREAMESLEQLTGGDVVQDVAPLLNVQAIRPQQYIMQIDAITNHLATLGDGDETRIRVGGRGGRPVLTTVTLDMPDHMRLENGATLSTYDKSIINGITSLIESGNTVFSLPMLYHAMTGKQNPTVDEQLQEELTGKLEKMRRMMLTIDLTEENEARYLTGKDGDILKIEDLQLEGYLLPLNKVSGTVNGKKAELYQIIQHPPLYTYSKMKRQLASVKISLLNAPINNNSTTIPLKTYLLQRIEMMKNKRNHIISTHILFESIYKELGAEDAGKTKKLRIRTYTETILQHFVDQGYIDGFSIFKRGRTIAGINIEI